MAILHIFGDESGTMPLNDTDGPFVAATVSFLGEPPNVMRDSNKDETLVSIFKNLNAVPFAAIVKPFLGYKKALKNKYDKMQVMARATALVMGSSSQSLDQAGLTPRNIVWTHAMTQAIVNAVGSIMFDSDINSVRILLDEKTLSHSMRLLFSQTLLQMGTNFREFLTYYRQLNPAKMFQYKNNIQFSAANTSINWSDDSGQFRSEFGLKLAHRLASKTYHQLKDSGKKGIETKLRDAGFEDFIKDITDIVTNLDQRLIDNFRQNTGLPEPREL